MRSRRDQIAEAKRLGLIVQPVRRTGEMRFLEPMGGPSVRVNNRRKDGTLAVEALLAKHRPTPTPKEAPPVPARPTQTPAASPMDVARAAIKGHSSEDVIRALAREPKANLELVALVERFDRAVIRKDPPPATCSANCEWCDRHPFTAHPITKKGKTA